MIDNQKINNFSFLISYNFYRKLLNSLSLNCDVSIYYKSIFQVIKILKY